MAVFQNCVLFSGTFSCLKVEQVEEATPKQEGQIIIVMIKHWSSEFMNLIKLIWCSILLRGVLATALGTSRDVPAGLSADDVNGSPEAIHPFLIIV